MAAIPDAKNDGLDLHFRGLVQGMTTHSCLVNHSVFYDKNTDEMVVNIGTSAERYKYHIDNGLKDLMDSGFRAEDKWACKGNNITALILIKPSLTKGSRNFMLVFCDDIKKDIIGVTPVVHNNKDSLQYVEVFSCDLSSDKSILGFVLGILEDGDSSTHLYFYDTTYWLPVRVFEGQSMIPPAFAFHPSHKHSLVLLMGLHDEPYIELFSLESGTVINSSFVDFYDIDGETSLKLTFTGDGCFFVCQVIENLGYSIGFMGRSYVLRSDTFAVVDEPKPKAFIAPTCHQDCDPLILPVFSPGFRNMALPVKEKGKIEANFQVYKMPQLLSLKDLCRQEINELRTGDVGGLNLTDEMEAYLLYKPTSA